MAGLRYASNTEPGIRRRSGRKGFEYFTDGGLRQNTPMSPALPALGDRSIDRWRHLWRLGPWLGWLCWLGALATRLSS